MRKTPLLTLSPKRFEYIPETSEFLDLFDHRGSFIWAEHPAPGQRPEWTTEERHLLSDRLINQGAYLYGVSFGAHTNYLMIDIDHSSGYHPHRDPLAIGRLVAALEQLGLTSYVAVQSSDRGGLHLYFPFVQGQPSWAIAQAAQLLLETSGYKLIRGQLELFPNPRREVGANYNAHRLPLQTGSYLLNADFLPVFGSHPEFVQRWRFAQNRNSVDRATIEEILKQKQRRNYGRVRGSARKFLNDLNAEIEVGWTAPGQTNAILGRIAMREYIFYHVLYGCSPLSGSDLASRIWEVAIALPGYRDYCQHQGNIAQRAEDWARSVESSRYYPYEGKQNLAAAAVEQPTEPGLSWNQLQSEDARERIRIAVALLEESESLPDTVRGRLFAIRNLARVSSDTLYRNRDLWHPENRLKPSNTGVIHPIQEDRDEPRSLESSDNKLIHPVCTISFKASSDHAPTAHDTEMRPNSAVGGAGGVSTAPPDEFRALLLSIKCRRRPRGYFPELSQPPDEKYFEQLALLKRRKQDE